MMLLCDVCQVRLRCDEVLRGDIPWIADLAFSFKGGNYTYICIASVTLDLIAWLHFVPQVPPNEPHIAPLRKHFVHPQQR